MRIICFSLSFKHLVPESIIRYLCVVGYRTTCSSSLLLCWLRDCHVFSVSAKHLFIYFNKFILFLSQIFSSAAFQQEVQAGLPALEEKKSYAFPVFTETFPIFIDHLRVKRSI